MYAAIRFFFFYSWYLVVELEVKPPEREANHLPPSSAEVNE